MLIACFTTAGLLLARGVTRGPELGVRLALGARKADLFVLAIGDSLRWAAAGIASGGVLALLAARGLAGALYEVPPADFASFAGAIAVASAVVVLGATLAARSALHVDPLVVLRD